ncbi:hypothetical protein EW145_g4000 [Phellinidium pouzarii]|uniref:Formamidase n=1 Tax=Phellinidium pouzarii TaxID=167371 RepID=A0A4V3XCN5_9AGAM|nr:hypothetical protein EW145_g4000 [Phellinidium pouzarii]
MSIHAVKRSQCHLAWDKSIPPVLYVASGETVTFDCLDASNGQIIVSSTSASLHNLVLSQLDQVCGPIAVAGALPGDTLRVDVVALETANWGWTALVPGFGLLADEFPEPALKIWSIDKENGSAWFNEEKGIKIPIHPFAGEMGVARGVDGAFSTIPPYNTGVIIDTKHVTVGSTLYLPIEAPGALFSIGDGHAAQGDGGEYLHNKYHACGLMTSKDSPLCRGTAIETPIKVTVRLTVVKDKSYVKTPHYQTHVVPRSNGSDAGDEYYCTTGVGSEIREAARDAVRHMIVFLIAEHGLDRIAAYMLCSVAGDLRMHEVVDMPNYVASLFMSVSC